MSIASSDHSWVSGFCWGLLQFTLILFPVCQVIMDHAYGTLRILLFCILICYLAMTASLFFKATSFLMKKYESNFIFGLACTVYYFFLVQFSLPCIGLPIDCAVLYPLLPLIYQESSLNILIAYNEWMAVTIIVTIAAFISQCIIKKKKGVGIAVFLLAAAILYWQSAPELPPRWINQIAVCSMKNIQSTSAWQRAQEMLEEIQRIKRRSPDVQLIIAPESAFPHPLNEYPVFVSMWSEYGLQESSLIIGAHRKENGIYNTAYLIEKGGIAAFYDKSLCMPLSELPGSAFVQRIGSFFNETVIPFKQAVLCNNRFMIDQPTIPPLRMLICSELLCAPVQIGKDSNVSELLICIANDSWFTQHSAKRVMLLCAQFRALQAHKAILYISHEFVCFISAHGADYIIQ